MSFGKGLAQPVAEFFGPFGQIPLEMTAEPGVVIQDGEQDRINPAAVGQEHAQGAVMEIQMPEAVDIFALIAADFPGLIAVLGRLSSWAMDGSTARALE